MDNNPIVVAGIFLFLALIGAVLGYFALARTHFWLLALVAQELSIQLVVLQLGLAGLFVALGALDNPVGWIALGLTIASVVALAISTRRSFTAKTAMRKALTGVGLALPTGPPPSWLQMLKAMPSVPESVTAHRDIPYGKLPAQVLDLFVAEDTTGPVPVLLQIHGGGWRGGHKEREARPLVYRMADEGWACLSIGYRLSPEATFPDHIVDVKRAIGWARQGLQEFGLEAKLVVVTGGSAGAHLASLAALTPAVAEFQPGFEEADTTVDGCIAFYGIYDMLNRNRLRNQWPFVTTEVMKTSPHENRAAWEAASPIDHVDNHAPPFFLLHGSHDRLVPPAESRQMVARLRHLSSSQVVYAELPGATHGFDFMHSVRSRHVINGVAQYLHYLHLLKVSNDPADSTVDSGTA